jgi:phenylalanyl-tRNA synthetase alpha chain
MISDAQKHLQAILDEARAAVESVSSLSELNTVDITYLGRKGKVAQQMKLMKDLPNEDKPAFGKIVNEVKQEVAELIAARNTVLTEQADGEKLQKDAIDVTLPGRPAWQGSTHPLTQTLQEINETFQKLGFAVEEGPEVEDEWHNFDALNIPASHPARDVQDTFFVNSTEDVDMSDNRMILRTHTSPVQIRVMQNEKPPVRFIAPGRVYRNERIDASHYTIFHQVEGLYVDKGVDFAQLKGTLLAFAHSYYGPNVDLRFRPGYFPFTEPSAEVDITCTVCSGKGCSVCKQTGWVEILGSGMVHPNVFRAVGYDPDEVTGFAFGMGVERIAMLKYGIDDIRLLFENDVRFLRQFA